MEEMTAATWKYDINQKRYLLNGIAYQLIDCSLKD
jgi:hypothetical protein